MDGAPAGIGLVVQEAYAPIPARAIPTASRSESAAVHLAQAGID
jgi:hypothetical protein